MMTTTNLIMIWWIWAEQDFYDDFYPEDEDAEEKKSGKIIKDHLYEEHDAKLDTNYFDDPEAESGDEYEKDEDEDF